MRISPFCPWRRHRVTEFRSHTAVGSTITTVSSSTNIRSGFNFPFGPSKTGSQWGVHPTFTALFARILHNELCRRIRLLFTDGHQPEMCPTVSTTVPQRRNRTFSTWEYRRVHSRVGTQFVWSSSVLMASPSLKVPALVQELHFLKRSQVSVPVPWVPWLARYWHHFSFGTELFPSPQLVLSLWSLRSVGDVCLFWLGGTGLRCGYRTHRSSSVSLTPRPRAIRLMA